MPGIDLNLDLPSLSDNMATMVAKTRQCLSDIEDDLAGQITSSEININAALSFNGAAATNLGSITLADGNPPSAAGSMYYEDGEFWLIDSTGVIQLTQLGALKVTGAGGIIGDYGTGDEAVSYDTATQTYTFTAAPGVYADIAADDLILYGTNGSVRLGTAAGITTARSFLFNSLPASGIRLLAYDASGSTVEDASTVTIGGNYTFSGTVTLATGSVTTLTVSGSATIGGNLTVTGDLVAADYTHTVVFYKQLPLNSYWAYYQTGTLSGQTGTVSPMAALGTLTCASLGFGSLCAVSFPVNLRAGDRVISAVVKGTKINGTSTYLNLYKLVDGVETQINLTATPVTTTGAYTITGVSSSPYTILDTDMVFLRVFLGTVGDTITSVKISWDHP